MRSLLLTGLAFASLALVSGRARAGGADPNGSRAETLDVAESTGDATVDKWVKRFKGSILIVDQSITPDTVAPGVQLSPVPSYQWWFSLRPRFYITPKFSLRARADLTIEALNGSDTTLYHQRMWGDLWLDAIYSGIPKFLGVDTTVGWRFLFPTSLTSQMRGVMLSTGPTLGLNRDFPTRIGEFSLSAAVAGTYNFLKANTGSLANGAVYDCDTIDFIANVCNQSTPAVSTLFQLTALVGAKYAPTSKLSLNVNYIIIDQWAPAVGPTTLTDATGGTTVVTPDANMDQRMRQYGWFLASVDYDVTKWVSLSAGYYVFRPVLDPDSHYGDPFWSPGGNTRVFLSATFGLEQLAAGITRLAKAPHRSSSASSGSTATAATQPLSPTLQ